MDPIKLRVSTGSNPIPPPTVTTQVHIEPMASTIMEPMAYESFHQFDVCPGVYPQWFALIEPGTRNFRFIFLLSTHEASVAEGEDSFDFEGIYSCPYSSCLFSFLRSTTLLLVPPFIHLHTTLSFEFNQDS